jgi:hypothetical protein
MAFIEREKWILLDGNSSIKRTRSQKGPLPTYRKD